MDSVQFPIHDGFGAISADPGKVSKEFIESLSRQQVIKELIGEYTSPCKSDRAVQCIRRADQHSLKLLRDRFHLAKCISIPSYDHGERSVRNLMPLLEVEYDWKLKRVTTGPEKPCYDAILDVADELLREHGYKRMTMDDVASGSGLGKGTLYLYFDSKEDLALSCIDRKNLLLREKLKAVARGPLGAPEKLEAMLKERVLLRLKLAQGHKTGFDDLLFALRQQLFERRDRYHHEEALLFAEVLVEGRTTGAFDIDEPYETAMALITATNSLMPYSLSPRELIERIQVERSIGRLAPMLVKSVMKPTEANVSALQTLEQD